MQLPGTSVKIVVTSHGNATDLASDFQSALTSELLKNDPRLHISDNADSIINCQILSFEQPPPVTTTTPGVKQKDGTVPQIPHTRVTGQLRVTFQSRTRAGQTLGSDNVTEQYDEEFDASSGNAQRPAASAARLQQWHQAPQGRQGSKTPLIRLLPGELRTNLFNRAVHHIVSEVVVTQEIIEVNLAKGKGLDEGVKDAEAGLWTRALESWETAKPLDKLLVEETPLSPLRSWRRV